MEGHGPSLEPEGERRGAGWQRELREVRVAQTGRDSVCVCMCKCGLRGRGHGQSREPARE